MNHRPTTLELAREAEREVTWRRVVYANQVRAGKMKQQEADYRIGLMAEIARRLRAEVKIEEED